MRKNNTISAVAQSPFPHVVVEDFLDDDTLDLVIDALQDLNIVLVILISLAIGQV